MLSAEEIKVAAEALGSDAAVWDDISSRLADASAATNSMHSSDAAFCWKGDELYAQYSEIITAVASY